MRAKVSLTLLLRILVLLSPWMLSGCGRFIANRIVQAPNTYPSWFAPTARVSLGMTTGIFTNFTDGEVTVGPPFAKLHYRVIPAADYHLELSSSNWIAKGQSHFSYDFKASYPGTTNAWTHNPKGTIFLLHGYGLAKFAMAPWALQLASEGWQTILLDLRGHGRSTGDRIFFGLREGNDLSQLLDVISSRNQAPGKLGVVGESYGASLALRWATMERRISSVVAIAPYASLSNSIVNIASDYVPLLPKSLAKAGAGKLPQVLNCAPEALDLTQLLAGHASQGNTPVKALFIVGTRDKITPPDEVKALVAVAAAESRLALIEDATHESVTYRFAELIPLIRTWLESASR